MSETAESLITDALGEAFINAQEQPTESVDMQKGIRYLNRMMAELDSRGISLGYTVVDDPSDLITVPDGAINGVIYNLAIKLAPSYGEAISIELSNNAKLGMSAMVDLAVEVLPRKLPCTLPVGSGNDDRFRNRKFFPCPDDTVLTEDNGNIILETST